MRDLVPLPPPQPYLSQMVADFCVLTRVRKLRITAFRRMFPRVGARTRSLAIRVFMPLAPLLGLALHHPPHQHHPDLHCDPHAQCVDLMHTPTHHLAAVVANVVLDSATIHQIQHSHLTKPALWI